MGGQRPEEGDAHDHSEGEAKIDVGQVLVFARGCVSWGEPALNSAAVTPSSLAIRDWRD